MGFIFDSPPIPNLPIHDSDKLFPVRRIFCVGRNYAAHAREMGNDPDREPPFYFMKPNNSLVHNGKPVPYPPQTENLHYEGELVVAIGKEGSNIQNEDALDHIFGYAVGNDLTRRDLQKASKELGRPWDTAKGFDHSAPCTEIHTVEQVGHIADARISLTVNGEIKQDSNINKMIWSIPEVVVNLSGLFTLMPGDLIFTGTPEGVGPINKGDQIKITIDGLTELCTQII